MAQWNPRANEIFVRAVEIVDAQERAAFLAQNCGADEALRREVDSLIVASQKVGDYLEQPAIDREETALKQAIESSVGMVIAGRYKLIEQIGEGGMGTVYMAQQIEPVKRAVAVKMIKPGMDSKAVLARFEAERQALAMMDHQNIARVLDAGTTEQGRLYFVMELVKGVSITKFCDDRKLTAQQRLELFVPVCQAIQHAHQKGVLHRDIKPSNVLVAMHDDVPVPKVIDFGMAKATGQTLTDKTLMTWFGAVVGTPEYMSPEQASFNQIDVDTRSDVYALGVLLYELLTGSTPLDCAKLGQAALLEVLRIVREQDPQLPSTRLSSSEALPSIAANRNIEPARLSKLLKGELDYVVMKALEKDRSRRYETASSLARDIQRYLNDEEVEAQPPSVAYKFSKFVRRHMRAVIAGAIVVIALVAGIIGITFGLIQAQSAAEEERMARSREASLRADAEADRDRARQAEKLAAERFEQVKSEKKKTLEEKHFADSMRHFLQDKLLGQADSLQQAESLLLSKGVANETYWNPTVRELLDRAASELSPDRIERNFPGQLRLQAGILKTIGETYRAVGDWGQAISFLQRAVALLRQEWGENHLETLSTKANLGVAYRDAGRLSEAIGTLEEVCRAMREHYETDHVNLLVAENNLAEFYRDAGRQTQAIELLESLQRRMEKTLGKDHYYTLIARANLAHALHDANQLMKALQLCEQVKKEQEAKYGSDHPITLKTINSLAVHYQANDKHDEAIRLLEQSRSMHEKVFGPEHPSTLSLLNNLAVSYRNVGKWQEAITLLEQCCKIEEGRYGIENPATVRSFNNLAILYLDTRRLKEAIAIMLKVSQAMERKHGRRHEEYLVAINTLAGVYREMGNYTEAIGYLEHILAVREAKSGSTHPLTLAARNNLASGYWSADMLEKSIPLFESILKQMEQTLGRDNPNTVMARGNLGINYRDAGKLEQAVPLLEEAYQKSKGIAPLNFMVLELAVLRGKMNKPQEATKLVEEYLEKMRAGLKPESAAWASLLSTTGDRLMQWKDYAKAETLLQECLAIREKLVGAHMGPGKQYVAPWQVGIIKSMLGEALMGQQRYADAKSLMEAGYLQMKQDREAIPEYVQRSHLSKAVNRLIRLAEATKQVGDVEKWKKEMP